LLELVEEWFIKASLQVTTQTTFTYHALMLLLASKSSKVRLLVQLVAQV
jgi:hypothetical protein